MNRDIPKTKDSRFRTTLSSEKVIEELIESAEIKRGTDTKKMEMMKLIKANGKLNSL